jgi:hypothetical protein
MDDDIDGPADDVTDAAVIDEAGVVDLPGDATADDGEEEDGIPGVVMAAIKDRMHARKLSAEDDLGHLEVTVGTGDAAIHVVDDGPEHCMVGRTVGQTSDGCVYCLVARVSLYGYEQLRDGEIEAPYVFADSRDISVLGVYAPEGLVENIAVVSHYRHAHKIPVDYLPPHPMIEFSDEDSPSDED